jgi:hypothetical protein
MPTRIKALFILPLFLLFASVLQAQDSDYLKHGKAFCICSFWRECTLCSSCDKDRYEVKLDNHADKRIKSVSYKFYSAVFNRILERDAKIEGDRIEKHQTGKIHICIPDGTHWIISKVVYDDDSAITFTLHGRMENFLQEPDECDCND